MRMRAERHLQWDGCFNVRDLGGLPTTDGRTTRWGALVRADSLQDLTAAGWVAVLDHGVRTVIDLRNDEERGQDAAPRPAGIRTMHLALDAIEVRDFWNVWEQGAQFGTPLYYRPHLERFPERSAAVVAEIARAEPGGVVFHCGGGRDRAGQISMLVLALAGVSSEEINADYELSVDRLKARYAARGEPDQGPVLQAFLAGEGTTAGEVISATLDAIDVKAVLLRGGLTEADVSGLRHRFLVQNTDPPSKSTQIE